MNGESTQDEAFRKAVRAFLRTELTPELKKAGARMTSVYADHEASMEWQRILHAKGWAAPPGRWSMAAQAGVRGNAISMKASG